MSTVTYYVTDADDDGYFSSSALVNTGNSIYIGNQGTTPRTAFFKFRGVAIPFNSVIVSAKLSLYCYTSKSTTDVLLNIYGEAAGQATTISDLTDALSRSLTTAYVAWDNLPSWTAGTVYDSPDFKEVIQEIVQRSDWAWGHALQLFIKDDGSTNDTRRIPGSYESTYPALLTIEYLPPVVPRGADHSQSAEEPIIVPILIMAVQEAGHAQAADVGYVGTVFVMVEQEGFHEHTSEEPVVTRCFVLATQEAFHSLKADSIVITVQPVEMAVGEAHHMFYSDVGTFSDNVTILEVSSTWHVVTTSTPVITFDYAMLAGTVVNLNFKNLCELIEHEYQVDNLSPLLVVYLK
jgi:hypothetical protein